MLLTLPNGEVVDTALATPQKGPVTGPYAPLEISVSSTGSGVIDSGSEMFTLAGKGGAWINFYTSYGGGQPVARAQLDDSAALTTAMSQISAAIAGGCLAASMATTGNVTWTAPGS